MPQITDTSRRVKRTPAEAHIRNVDQPDAVVGRQDDIAEMNRSEINSLLVKRLQEIAQLACQIIIKRRVGAIISEGGSFQGLIMNGRALDGWNAIDAIDVYGGDAPGYQLDGIAPEANGIGEQACRGYQPFETEQL